MLIEQDRLKKKTGRQPKYPNHDLYLIPHPDSGGTYPCNLAVAPQHLIRGKSQSQILVAEQRPANVHDIPNGGIRNDTKHIQLMRQGGDVARVALGQGRTRRWNQSVERGKGFQCGEEDGQTSRVDVGRHKERVGHIRAADVAQAGGQVASLPVPPELVQPGVVEVEEGIARAGDAVEHLAADASVAANVRGELNTGPKVDVILDLHARVDVGLAGREAHRIVDDTVDATLGVADAVPRAEAVLVLSERAIRDAPVGAGTISAEAGNRVKNDRLGKLARIPRFIPVSKFPMLVCRLRNGTRQGSFGGGGGNLRLSALVPTLFP